VGVKGGLVLAVADDPGPISSQTEQDTRHFAKYAKLVLFDPATPEEAYLMVADAFFHSERTGRPVILRPTTRVCHSYASVTMLPELPRREPEGFTKDGGRFVIFPRLTYANHIRIEDELVRAAEDFSSYEHNALTGSGKRGIATGGVTAQYVKEALEGVGAECKLLKVSTVPFPTQMGLLFLDGLEEVLVAEELDPVIERELIHLCGVHGIRCTIRGKLSGDMPSAGEHTANGVARAVAEFLGVDRPEEEALAETPPLPVRPPVLCAGCPHRGSFFAVKEACKGKKAVFSGDIGCYTLGNALPLDMVDTCLCMGAGITIAQGLNRVEPDAANFAFVGDSTFFHTGIPGVVNAVYNRANVIICILDNLTTAMTGNQPHPGIGRSAMGEVATRVDIEAIVRAIGVQSLRRVNAFDVEAGKTAVQEALGETGVRVLLFTGPCIAVKKGDTVVEVSDAKCTGCAQCVKRLGCPALSMQDGKARVDETLCTGCGVCKTVCRFGALEGGVA
jgi:indolepyruvate ferredoxin oxidoreductase alpha subunit